MRPVFTVMAAFGKMHLCVKTVSEHPEDLRLGASGSRDVTLYSRPGCHLCEEAKAAIAPLLREFKAVLHEVNVEEDPLLQERYGWDIPVIFIGRHKAAKHRVDLAQFRRQLQEAGSS
jgi:glutaredoxin